jgi:hypothetical protein
MQAQLHSMSNLFAQLGLPADDAAIEDFIARHRPLASALVALAQLHQRALDHQEK